MGNSINDVTTCFNELSSTLSNVEEQLKSISDTFKTVADSMSKINVGDVMGIGSFIVDFASLSLSSVQMCSTIENSISDIFKALESEAKKLSKLSQQLGRDIANGISEGLKDGINVVKMSTTVICNDGVLETIKDELQIKSPSKAMKRIASSIPEGIVDAIKDGQAGIKKAMGNSVEVIEDASKKMSKLKFGLGGLAAVTAIVVPLIDYFVNMMSTNETLSAKMEEIWAKICEAFKPVTDTVINLFNQFTTGSESSVSALDTVLAAVGVAAEVLAGVVESIAGFFAEYGDEIMAIVSAVWEHIGGIVAGAIDVFGGAFDLIVGIFTGNGEKIRSGFADIYDGIKAIFSGLTGFFSSLWSKIKSVFVNIGSTIGNGIGNAFKTVINSIIGFAEGTINKFIRAINGDAYHKQVLKRVQVIMGE